MRLPCCIRFAQLGRWDSREAVSWPNQFFSGAATGLASTALSLFLADGVALPDDYATTFALATDDLMIFSVAPPHNLESSKLQRRAFDDVIIKHGLIPATEKDVDDQPSATCIGIDIDDGYYPGPMLQKLRCFTLLLLDS